SAPISIGEAEMSDRLPRLYPAEGTEPALHRSRMAWRSSRSLAERAGDDPRGGVAVYGVQELHYREIPDREQCWARLGQGARDRLLSRAGKLLDWWAVPDDQGRMCAVVLGADALVTAEPMLNDA